MTEILLHVDASGQRKKMREIEGVGADLVLSENSFDMLSQIHYSERTGSTCEMRTCT